MGGSMADARASINAFIENGINEDRFRQFGIAAQGLAERLGIDIPEAASKLASAFAGGLDAVLELNKEMNFLTPAVAETAIAMAESGDEAGALNLILAELEATGQKLADKAGGPWSQAFRDLGVAWNAFVDALKNSAAIQGTIALVDALSTAVANLIGGLGRLLTKAVNTAQTISNLPGFDSSLARSAP